MDFNKMHLSLQIRKTALVCDHDILSVQVYGVEHSRDPSEDSSIK